MSAATYISIGSKVLGGLKSNKADRKAARRAERRGREQQAFNQIAAQEWRAIGQMRAFEEKRQARLVASRAVAVAAAGGAVSDITHLLADIDGEGAYRASVALHEAESQAFRLEFEGEQAAKYGRDQAEGFRNRAKARTISTIGSVFSDLADLE